MLQVRAVVGTAIAASDVSGLLGLASDMATWLLLALKAEINKERVTFFLCLSRMKI